ncbi:DUF2283 domain-containing protein [Austwickia sp. TVS 96-490-7B]|uniref:DUF2283 domain-containing protein n=1 Tax=Austwickia sp. TVS 96-490-7B TaxID=2830843 RepID=UPI00351CE8E1
MVDEIAPGEATSQVQVHGSDSVDGRVIFDFDAEGKLLGIEILFASEILRKSTLNLLEST